jgi:hypothetical protein
MNAILFTESIIFASETYVERFEPLATTEKNAKMYFPAFFSPFIGSFFTSSVSVMLLFKQTRDKNINFILFNH